MTPERMEASEESRELVESLRVAAWYKSRAFVGRDAKAQSRWAEELSEARDKLLSHLATLESAQRKRDRLREALRKIAAATADLTDGGMAMSARKPLSKVGMQMVARRALQGEGDGDG